MNSKNSTKSGLHTEGKTLLSGKVIAICVILMSLAIVAITIFKIPLGTLFFAGSLLLCPLLHIWMMKSGGHKH